MKLILYTVIPFLLLSVAVSGCETVKPWQRDIAARKDMAWVPDPLDAANQHHIFFSKEASSDPAASGGGGCGCN
jgi:hypothetical protein